MLQEEAAVNPDEKIGVVFVFRHRFCLLSKPTGNACTVHRFAIEGLLGLPNPDTHTRSRNQARPQQLP